MKKPRTPWVTVIFIQTTTSPGITAEEACRIGSGIVAGLFARIGVQRASGEAVNICTNCGHARYGYHACTMSVGRAETRDDAPDCEYVS